MKAWRLDGLGGALVYADVAVPEPKDASVVVAVEASLLLSYQKRYVAGALLHYRPPRGPFTIGSSGVGTIAAIGRGVYHLAIGQRVVISPHVVANERVDDRAQILLGLTSLTARNDALQADWRDGTLAEFALVPASVVTPLDGLAIDSATLTLLGRFAVPYGGLVRGRLAAGERVVVIGATGSFGTAAVVLALALGASRVVAAGRDRTALARLATLGPRVRTIALAGDVARDAAALRDAAGGGADLTFDMVGRATDPNATLAGLRALVRGGRLVLMGSMTAPVPIDYYELMINDWEILGQFIGPADAIRRLVELVRGGLLDLGALRVATFPISELVAAMDAAETADNFTGVAVTA